MFDDIYNIFKLELDGEEFDSDDDALLAGNVAYREVLNKKDWKFLKKTYTLPLNGLSLASITDLDKILAVWLNGTQLKKATFEQRFDTSFDYWVDLVNNLIVPINSFGTSFQLIVDYKYRPVDISDTVPAVKSDLMNPVIAYKMGLNYYRKDQDLSVYSQLQDKYTESYNLLIDHNESL